MNPLPFDSDRGNSARSILLALGMGDFNATMVIQYLFLAPAQTDPQMAQIIMLTRHLQEAMQSMGVRLPASGSIDSAWEPYFVALVGRQWQDLPWAEVARMVIEAKARGRRLDPKAPIVVIQNDPLSGVLDSLPQIPGGLFTYAVGGYLLWRHMKRKGR